MLCTLAALLVAGYFLWLRDSSLVAVENVSVSGLTTTDAGAAAIRAALIDAAREMTTLNADAGALERAVADQPAVARIELDRDLPHGLAIEVVEREPVAVVAGPGEEDVAVAADGTLLPDANPAETLARIEGTERASSGGVEDPAARATLAAVAAASPALARRIEAVEEDGGELLVTLVEGPAILLGDGSDLEDKWTAAAAALADGGAADAGYLDVSLPGRPVAGG